MPANQSPSPFDSIAPSRRTLLKSLGLATAGIAAGPLLAACTGGSKPSSSGGGSASKSLTVGSGSSDDVPKRAYQAVFDAFSKQSGDTVKVNTVPHNDFQNNINSYLNGSPDDVFTWFAGYRMRYYAGKGLAA